MRRAAWLWLAAVAGGLAFGGCADRPASPVAPEAPALGPSYTLVHDSFTTTVTARADGSVDWSLQAYQRKVAQAHMRGSSGTVTLWAGEQATRYTIVDGVVLGVPSGGGLRTMEEDCTGYYYSYVAAVGAMVAAAGAMAVACTGGQITSPVFACLAATAVYLAAVSNMGARKADYDACLARNAGGGTRDTTKHQTEWYYRPVEKGA